MAVVLAAAAGCGGGSDATPDGSPEANVGVGRILVDEAGEVGPGDTTDPNHMNLPYDAFVFSGEAMDRVSFLATAEGFSPILKLVESSTGAVLAEWDAEYPTGDNLAYTLAAGGDYEARIYATGGDTGTYTLQVVATR